MKTGSKKKWALAAIAASPFVYSAIKRATDAERGSFALRGTSMMLRFKGKELDNVSSFVDHIRSNPERSAAPMPAHVRRSLKVEETDEGGFRVVTLAPRSKGSDVRMIYLHGGAYVNPLVGEHWDIVRKLVEATGATVTVPMYPLAPEHDYLAAQRFVLQVYERIIQTTAPRDVVLAGDSAGGGLAVSTALEARSKGLPVPGRLVLFSPWLDLTLADPAARDIEKDDVMLGVDALRQAGKWWAGGMDPASPILNALNSDLTGLPPIDIFQGVRDLLVVDSRTFATKARLAGVDTRYFEYPGAFHVFMAATFTPEASDVFRIVGDSVCLPR